MDHKEIDFDKELEYGHQTYDKRVGDWWEEQSVDEAHKKGRDLAQRLGL